MGLLGDSWDDPRSQAIMALSGGLLQGNLGAGLLGANQAVTQAKEAAVKQKLIDAQMRNYDSEIEARKLKAAQDQRQQAMIRSLVGGGPDAGSPASPSAAGSIMELSQRLGIPAQAIQADLAFNGGKKISEIINSRSAPKWENINGNLVDVNAQGFKGGFQPGMAAGKDGQVTAWQPDGQGGLVVGAPRGAMDTYRAFKDVDAGVAAGNDLVKVAGPDGAERYVTRAQAVQAAQPPATPRPAIAVPPARPAGAARPLAPQPGDSERAMIYQAEMAAAQQRLSAATTPIEQQRAQNDIAGLTQEMQRAGVPMQASHSTAQRAEAKSAEVTAQETAKDVSETRKGIMNAAFSAPVNIAKYQKIGQLLQDVDGGSLTPAGTQLASAANSLGIKIDKNLSNKEAAASLANEAALQLRNPSGGAGMPGALSDQDRTFLVSMTPTVTQSADGRKLVISSYVAVQKRNQQVATFARNYEKKYGRLDNGFFEQMQAWSNANPLFGGK